MEPFIDTDKSLKEAEIAVVQEPPDAVLVQELSATLPTPETVRFQPSEIDQYHEVDVAGEKETEPDPSSKVFVESEHTTSDVIAEEQPEPMAIVETSQPVIEVTVPTEKPKVEFLIESPAPEKVVVERASTLQPDVLSVDNAPDPTTIAIVAEAPVSDRPQATVIEMSERTALVEVLVQKPAREVIIQTPTIILDKPTRSSTKSLDMAESGKQ